MMTPDGSVGHAEVEIGDSVVMMAEAKGETKPMPTMVHLYVRDADATYKRALKAGAVSLREARDEATTTGPQACRTRQATIGG